MLLKYPFQLCDCDLLKSIEFCIQLISANHFTKHNQLSHVFWQYISAKFNAINLAMFQNICSYENSSLRIKNLSVTSVTKMNGKKFEPRIVNQNSMDFNKK